MDCSEDTLKLGSIWGKQRKRTRLGRSENCKVEIVFEMIVMMVDGLGQKSNFCYDMAVFLRILRFYIKVVDVTITLLFI